MATEDLVFSAFWRDRGAVAGSRNFRKEVDATHSSVSKLGAVSSKFGGLGGLAFKAAGAAAVGFGLKVASGNEQARISFTTMLGSAQKADVFLRKLQQFAATTPFEFPELQTAASSLISAGINADKVIPIMRTLGDVTAGMGTGAEGVKRATIALQQMNAAGRITGEDLNQLRDAGIPVYDLLAAATGKSKEEVVKLAQAGKLGKKELGQMMAALESGKGLERFSGLMEKQAQSLAGMVSTLKDNVGQGLADILTPVFPAIKASLGAFNDLGSGAKTTFAVIAGGALVLGLAAKGALGLAAGFRTLGASASAARIATGGVGAALGIATLAFGLYAKKHAEAKERVADFTQALQSETAAVKQNVTAVAAKQLQDAGAFAAAQKLGLGLDLVTRAALGERAAMDEVNSVIDHYTQAGLNSADVDANIRVDAANDLGRAIGQTSDAYNGATAEAKQMAAATGGASTSMATAATKTEDLGKRQRELRIKLNEAKTAMQGLLDKMTIMRTGSLGLEQANLAWEEAIDGVTSSAKENGRSLVANTEKGRANRQAVINAMVALDEKTRADFKGAAQSRNSAKATREASERYKDNRAHLIRTALAAGYSKEEVRKMIGQFLKTPKKLETDVEADTKKARDQIRKLREALALVKSREAWIKFSTNAAEVAKTYGVSLKVFRGSTAAQGGRGYHEGGYTGNLPPWMPAGVVHGDEQVIPSRSRRRFETKYPGYLKHITEHGDIPGYQAGGIVRHLNVGTRGAISAPDFNAVGAALVRSVANRVGSILAPRFAGAGGGVAGGQGVGGPVGSLMSWRGGRFTQLAIRNLRRAEQIAGVAFRVFQGGWRPRTSYSGTSHAGDAIDTQASARVIRALRAVGWASGDRTGLGNWASHAHSVPGPSTGRARGSAVWQYQDYLRRGGARQGLGSAWGLASGGLLTARVAEKGPERILSARQTASFERMVSAMDRGRGAGGVTYIVNLSAPNYLGTADDLRRGMVSMARRGEMKTVLQLAGVKV